MAVPECSPKNVLLPQTLAGGRARSCHMYTEPGSWVIYRVQFEAQCSEMSRILHSNHVKYIHKYSYNMGPLPSIP